MRHTTVAVNGPGERSIRNEKDKEFGALLPLCISLIWQFGFCTVLGGLALFAFNAVIAYSLLVGTLIFIVPNAYFTYYAFRYDGRRWMPWVKRSFASGAMGKFSLVALGFALAFSLVKPLNEAALFVGFLSMLILQWPLAVKISAQRALDVSSKLKESNK